MSESVVMELPEMPQRVDLLQAAIGLKQVKEKLT